MYATELSKSPEDSFKKSKNDRTKRRYNCKMQEKRINSVGVHMKKDNVRDYVVSMFRFYSQCGQPTSEQINQLRTQLSAAAILDLIAVDNTLRYFDSKNKTVVDAIKDIYFHTPERNLSKNEISERVVKFSLEHYMAEQTVWLWLKSARRICAEQRNLNII